MPYSDLIRMFVENQIIIMQKLQLENTKAYQDSIDYLNKSNECNQTTSKIFKYSWQK